MDIWGSSPVCTKDFGNNIKLWKKHIKEKHYGAGDDALKFVKKIEKPNEDGGDCNGKDT